MKRIKIDVDGVLRYILPTMCRLYNEKYSEHLTVDDITDYNVSNVFTKCKDAQKFFFIDNGKEIFLNSEPCKKAREALQLLHYAGYKIIICTWQMNVENKKYTLDFLNDNDLYYDDICFTKDKYVIDADIIVDDNPEFLNNEVYSYVQKILIDAPYNKSVTDESFKQYNSLYNYVVDLLSIK